MKVDRSGIACRVPQADAMCLLDAVTQWDATHITCVASSPTETHPLARDGKVPAIAAVEYAAQATAVHGALLDTWLTPRAGMLAKLSDVELHTPYVPADSEGLNVHANLISRGESGCLYDFEVAGGHRLIVSGRLMVVFASASVL